MQGPRSVMIPKQGLVRMLTEHDPVAERKTARGPSTQLLYLRATWCTRLC